MTLLSFSRFSAFIFLIGLLNTPFAQGAGAVQIQEESPSIFFGDEEAQANFDYEAWASKDPIYKTDFQASQWDAKAPVPPLSVSGQPITLTRAQAEMLLLRFQKPGGFTLGNAEFIKAMLGSRFVKQNPSVVAGAMQNVLAVSVPLYDELLAQFPALKTLKFPQVSANPFRTEAEEAALLKVARRYYNQLSDKLISQSDKGTELSDWMGLLPLAPLLSKYEELEKVQHEDEVMENIQDKAMANEFKQSGASFLFPVIEPAIEPLFGDEHAVVTMLEMSRVGDTFTPRIHGTNRILGLAEKRNRYGFYSTDLEQFSLDDSKNRVTRTFLWSMAGHKFEGKVALSKLPKDMPLFSTEPSPKYEKMVHKGATHLLIVFGSNIQKDLANDLPAYLEYFKKKGFTDQGTKIVSKFKSWFKKQITSGETAIFDKEAHASSDVDNFLIVDNRVKMATFERTSPDKSVQIVRIAYPFDEDAEGEVITNQEFGKWVRAREAKHPVPLVMANLSCWSVDQARLQIPEIHSALFSEIFSTSVVDEFDEDEESGGRILFEGLMNGLPYAKIRENLKKDQGFVEGRRDAFVFPDEPRYKDIIFKGGSPVRIRWRITDIDTGEPYNGDNL